MKRKNKVNLAIGVLAAVLAGCSSDEPNVQGPAYPTSPTIVMSRAETDCNDGFNSFGLQFFNQISKDHGDKNFVVSPVGMAITMSMIANATDSECTASICEALNCEDLSDANSLSKKLMQFLPDAANQSTLTLANSLWIRNDINPLADFIDRVSGNYFCEITSIDVDSPQTLKTINGWCRKNTGNLLDSGIDRIDAGMLMMCVNALYFKAEWQNKFETSRTDSQVFYGLSSGKRVDMMHNSLNAPYFASETWEAVNLPYKGTNEMTVILPGRDIDIKEVASSIDINSLLAAENDARQAYVTLSMPKFESKLSIDCKEALQELGVKLYLDDVKNLDADYENSNGFSIEFNQNTMLKTNENGTEAASVSSGQLFDNISNIPDLSVNFNLNRPFIYLIRNKTTGSILLAGQYVQPTE